MTEFPVSVSFSLTGERCNDAVLTAKSEGLGQTLTAKGKMLRLHIVCSHESVMSNRFEAYGQTRIGRELAAIIDAPELVAEFQTLSAIDRPAVQAIAQHVANIIDALPATEQKHAANQFCGWRVGQIMRGLGYRLVRDRGRVSGAPFRTGAVWGIPNAGVRVIRSLPARVTRRIDFCVKRSAEGEVVGDWCAVQTATDPARRIHTVVESPKALAIAVENALAYAERWHFRYVLVIDPESLGSDFHWPVGE